MAHSACRTRIQHFLVFVRNLVVGGEGDNEIEQRRRAKGKQPRSLVVGEATLKVKISGASI